MHPRSHSLGAWASNIAIEVPKNLPKTLNSRNTN